LLALDSKATFINLFLKYLQATWRPRFRHKPSDVL
jgi:hypothetical protein